MLGGDQYELGRHLAPFFGKPTPMPTGPAYFSLKTGAPLVTIHTRRETDGHRIILGAPYHPPDLETGIRFCAAEIERWIRENPEQYAWLMRRNSPGADKTTSRARGGHDEA